MTPTDYSTNPNNQAEKKKLQTQVYRAVGATVAPSLKPLVNH